MATLHQFNSTRNMALRPPTPQSAICTICFVPLYSIFPCESSFNPKLIHFVPFRSRSRVNGATQTFRRPSVATTPSNSSSQAQAQAQPREMPPTPSTNHGGVYIPPHLNANHPSNSTRSLPLGDVRYSKDQLLTIYQTLKDTAALDRSLEDIFLGTWDPLDAKISLSILAGRGDSKDQTTGPEVCWNYTVDANPFGMTDLTEDEKQV